LTIVTFRFNKYNAKKTEYNGVLYDSKREAEYAFQLDMRLKARGKDRIKSWTRQVTLPLEVNGQLICKHRVDFEITHVNDSTEFVEVKGMLTPEYKLKLKLLRALYPDIKYTIA
jgi:phenylpropionate dioxygenase-like ring-hydroxylating dioxygenase large terminal subunit